MGQREGGILALSWGWCYMAWEPVVNGVSVCWVLESFSDCGYFACVCLVKVEIVYLLNICFIVIVKKSSATESSCCTKNTTIMESLPRDDDK